MREEVVKEFMQVMGQEVGNRNPSKELLMLRYNLLTEEVAEIGEELSIALYEINQEGGIKTKTYARLLKEMADLQYVLSGLAVSLGLDLEKAFYAVHTSNLSKLGDDGKPIYREDGKVLKGPNYKPVDLEEFI